jgi:hypothetical protein
MVPENGGTYVARTGITARSLASDVVGQQLAGYRSGTQLGTQLGAWQGAPPCLEGTHLHDFRGVYVARLKFTARSLASDVVGQDSWQNPKTRGWWISRHHAECQTAPGAVTTSLARYSRPEVWRATCVIWIRQNHGF